MSRAPRLLILALLVLATAACNRGGVKPNLPQGGAAVAPRVIYVDRDVYVRIDPSLTREEPIAEGPLSQCPDVAAQRKAALKRINARVRQIGEIQGAQVKQP